MWCRQFTGTPCQTSQATCDFRLYTESEARCLLLLSRSAQHMITFILREYSLLNWVCFFIPPKPSYWFNNFFKFPILLLTLHIFRKRVLINFIKWVWLAIAHLTQPNLVLFYIWVALVVNLNPAQSIRLGFQIKLLINGFAKCLVFLTLKPDTFT